MEWVRRELWLVLAADLPEVETAVRVLGPRWTDLRTKDPSGAEKRVWLNLVTADASDVTA